MQPLLPMSAPKYKGVTLAMENKRGNVRSSPYQARISCKGKLHSLGRFSTAFAAAQAYDAAAVAIGRYAETHLQSGRQYQLSSSAQVTPVTVSGRQLGESPAGMPAADCLCSCLRREPNDPALYPAPVQPVPESVLQKIRIMAGMLSSDHSCSCHTFQHRDKAEKHPHHVHFAHILRLQVLTPGR